MVRYAILGPVGLCDGERRVAVGGPRQVALLAVLLVNANRALSSDRLTEVLWGDQAVGVSPKRLQMAIARLRRALDPEGVAGESMLRTVAGGYLLAVRPDELDADMFEMRVQQGRRALQAGEAARARALLDDALGMWQGPVLADVAYEEFAQAEIRRLEEVRVAALEVRVDCELRLGEHDRLIAELESLVVAHPGRERLAAQLMLALYRCGRQGDALEVYARTRAYLATELGLQPGPALQGLQAEVLAQSPTLERLAEEHDGAPVVSSQRVMLPLPRTLHVFTDSLFVGRDTELERLRACWKQMTDGRRVAAFAGGEAGIGKTRLAAEFAGLVHGQGALVLYGRCDEGLAVPYQPFVEALRPYAGAAGADRLHVELGDLAPELGRLLPELSGLGEPIRADPESERFALFEAVAALVEAMTGDQPALIVVDDLHWATTPTLLLLRHLIRSERQLGALLLGTYREATSDLGQPLADLLADLHRDASAARLRLGGLDETAITALLEARVGHPLHDPVDLVRVLGAQTAGNPFFLRELLADVAESGAIFRGDERLSLEAMAARLEIPEGLRHVIGQRVARLPARARGVLRVAAVAAPTFSFLLLERVLGEPSGVLDALDEAVAAGLLVEVGNGDYAFAHALVRQTIYGELSAARRMRLHRELGEVLEASADPDAHVEALAHHFTEAARDGQAAKAADYALAAGRSAISRLGYEEAAGHYERGLHALTFAGQPSEQQRCELLLALAEARWATGELDKARQACGQATELASKLGDATLLARAVLGFCGPPRHEAAPGVTRPIIDLLQQALAALGEDDSCLRARLMGRCAIYTDFVQHKPVIARQALQIARRVGDTATLADVLASTHRATHGPDSLHESLALAEELGCVAEEIGDRRLRARAHGWLLEHLLEQGDIKGVERELDALQRLAQTQKRDHFLTWFVGVFMASYAHLGGRLEECETLTHDALAHRFEGRDELAADVFHTQMVFVRDEQGRLDQVVDTAEALAEQNPHVSGWRCALAFVYAQLERTSQARHELRTLAQTDFSDLPRDTFWMSNLSMLSEVVRLLGDADPAHLLYNLLLPYADQCAVTFALLCRGSTSRQLGVLATTLTRYDDAARHFEHALTMNTEIRSPLWVAHTQHDYACMLHLRKNPGDGQKAIRLLEQALASAEQLGLTALANKARALRLAKQR
jgi:DNA-binding SARP family transcriptional activator